jgi:hypothetical protein
MNLVLDDTNRVADRIRSRLEALRAMEARDQELATQASQLAKHAASQLGSQAEVTLNCERFKLVMLSREQDLTTTAQEATELIARCTEALGPNHEITLAVVWVRARCLRLTGDPTGIDEYRRILDTWLEMPDPPARQVRMARLNLSVALREQGDLKSLTEAFKIAHDEWQRRKEQYGETHSVTLIALSAYVSNCLAMWKKEKPVESLERLEVLASQVFQERLKAFGRQHRRSVAARILLADVLVAGGHANDAVWMLYSSRAEQAQVGSDTPELLYVVLAEALLQTNRPQDVVDAAPIAQQALAVAEKRYGAQAVRVTQIRQLVARIEALTS